MTSAGGTDVFYMKISGSDGQTTWAKKKGSTADDYGKDVAIDAAGDPVVVGVFQGTVNFGVGPTPSQGGYDAFAMKVNGTTGSTAVAQAWGSAGNEQADDVGVD